MTRATTVTGETATATGTVPSRGTGRREVGKDEENRKEVTTVAKIRSAAEAYSKDKSRDKHGEKKSQDHDGDDKEKDD